MAPAARPAPLPRFFATAARFRAWLAKHHADTRELWVGFHKVGTGRPSLTWPESVDEALCFGWIDGLRRRLDETSYAIRFTPRRATSTWSAVNLRRVKALEAAGCMRPAGLAVHRARDQRRSERHSFENRGKELASACAKRLKADERAWASFRSRPPWYRRTASWWVMSAKQEETRERRLAQLIACEHRGETVPPLRVARAEREATPTATQRKRRAH